MKKATIVVRGQDAEKTLSVMRTLGVLHVEYVKPPQSKEIRSIEEDVTLIDTAVSILSGKESDAMSTDKKKIEELKDWRWTAKHIIDLRKRLDQLEEYSRNIVNQIAQWQDWGDFDPVSILELADKGIYVRLYQIPVKEIKNLHRTYPITGFGSESSDFEPKQGRRAAPYSLKTSMASESDAVFRQAQDGERSRTIVGQKPNLQSKRSYGISSKASIVKIIKTKGGIAYCVVVLQNKDEIPYKEVVLPKMSLAKMQVRLSEDNKVMQSIKEEFIKLSGYLEDFLEIKKTRIKELEFKQVLAGMGESKTVWPSDSTLVYLTGYIPSDRVDTLQKSAKKERWGLLIRDPSAEDNVPVLLKNSWWVSLINPIYKLMEVVPNYRELDVSPIFLLFLALFFGMIIGDAGYGMVYFVLTFLAHRKFAAKTKDKTVFFLFYLFSFCAILWGVLTGTVFGQQWYLARGFKALMPALNDAKFLMGFCFVLGAVQLSLAHILQALVKLPSLTALSDIGFICLLWAGFFLAKMFILGDVFPAIGQKLVWLGVTLIIFFVSPQKNLLKTACSGLGTLALGFIGNFGDIVSYIRLFAVGLAGVTVADSVNILAQAAKGNILAQIIILFIGHSINIVLGPMSVLVHGIRLNVLEFSLLHGNVTWSGLPYKPLKE